MNRYETMVLLSPDLSDEKVEEHIANYERQITEGGGEVLQVDRWGKKRLAYPINRQRHGIYYVINYEANPDTIHEIERQLRLDEQTWRYMTVRMRPSILRKLEMNAKRAAAKAENESRHERQRAGASPSGTGKSGE